VGRYLHVGIPAQPTAPIPPLAHQLEVQVEVDEWGRARKGGKEKETKEASLGMRSHSRLLALLLSPDSYLQHSQHKRCGEVGKKKRSLALSHPLPFLH